jgi:hypothetical protein
VEVRAAGFTPPQQAVRRAAGGHTPRTAPLTGRVTDLGGSPPAGSAGASAQAACVGGPRCRGEAGTACCSARGEGQHSSYCPVPRRAPPGGWVWTRASDGGNFAATASKLQWLTPLDSPAAASWVPLGQGSPSHPATAGRTGEAPTWPRYLHSWRMPRHKSACTCTDLTAPPPVFCSTLLLCCHARREGRGALRQAPALQGQQLPPRHHQREFVDTDADGWAWWWTQHTPPGWPEEQQHLPVCPDGVGCGTHNHTSPRPVCAVCCGVSRAFCCLSQFMCQGGDFTAGNGTGESCSSSSSSGLRV